MKKIFLSYAFITLPVFYIVAQKITINGNITEAVSQEPLIGANIFITTLSEGTGSNQAGYYNLIVPKGKIILEVSYVGFETIELPLHLTKDTTINFTMKTTSLDVVEITSTKNKPIHENIGKVAISVNQLEKIPVLLGEPDLIKSIALTPGVSTGTEGTTGLFVRGGTPDQNLILLDGATVYNTSHLFGFLSLFNADAVKNVELWKGGIPSKYGGRVSSVMDINMKEGNMYNKNIKARFGILSSSILWEGPIKKSKSSFLLSGRSSYLGLFTLPVNISFNKGRTDEAGNYWMYDINAKIKHQLDNNTTLIASLFHGNDILKARERSISESTSTLKWGNTIAALKFTKVLSKRLFNHSSITYNNYHYGIQLESKEIENSGINLFFNNTSSVSDTKFKSNFDWLISKWQSLNFGMEYIDHTFRPGNIENKENTTTLLNDQPKFQPKSLSFYLEDKLTFSKVSFHLGARLFRYTVDKTNYTFLEPRVKVNLAISNQSGIVASYGKINQSIHLLTGNGSGLPNDIWVPALNSVPPVNGEQFNLGYSTDINNSKWNFTIETYYKRIQNLISFQAGANIITGGSSWQRQIETGGKGDAYGLELFLKKQQGKLTGWVGYTLSRSDRLFQNLNLGRTFPAKFDRRHDFEATAAYQKNSRWQFSANLVYTTGYRVTLPIALIDESIPIFRDINNNKSPDYFRLDAGAIFKKKNRKGRNVQWQFSIYNLTAKKNPFFLEYGVASEFNIINDDFIRTSWKGRVKQQTVFTILPSINYAIEF